MSAQTQKDLVILAADKNIEYTLNGILSRPQSLRIRQVTFDIYVHPERDPGCFRESDNFLRRFTNSHAHALVIFDKDGSGQEKKDREELEQGIEEKLGKSGWPSRATAIAIDPELEMWIWSDSPQVDRVLGWEGRQPDLRHWLEGKGFFKPGEVKPARPKEALEAALRVTRKARSSFIYLQIAEQVSFERCMDESFLKLKKALQDWFSE